MLQKLLSGPGRLITHFIGWGLVTLVTFYLLAGIRSPSEALGRTLLFLSFPMFLFYTNARVLINHFFEAKRYTLWVLLSIVLWFGVASARVWAELKIFGGNVLTSDRPPADGGAKMLLVTLVIYFILMIFSGLYQLLENRQELEVRHAEAQFNYLKAQINPHFLFNTLNNIYAAATLQHPNTPQMVLRLSDLLRYVTYDGQADRVPLSKEIAQIRAYLDLFQLKSETPLPIVFEVEGDPEGRQVEPLLLLPLVENALKHGDLEQNPKGFLRIWLRNDPARLVFEVENSFDPHNLQKDEQGGVGLENIRQRLALRYAERHRFEMSSLPNTFKARIELD